MYKDDGLSEGDMDALLHAFPNQTLDFFGALRYGQAGQTAGLLPPKTHAAEQRLCCVVRRAGATWRRRG